MFIYSFFIFYTICSASLWPTVETYCTNKIHICRLCWLSWHNYLRSFSKVVEANTIFKILQLFFPLLHFFFLTYVSSPCQDQDTTCSCHYTWCILAIQYQLLRQESLSTRAEVKGGILLLTDSMYKLTWEYVLFPYIRCARIWWVACDLYLYNFSIAILTLKAQCWGISGQDVCIGGYFTLLSPLTFSNWQKWLFYLLKIMCASARSYCASVSLIQLSKFSCINLAWIPWPLHCSLIFWI